MQTAWVQFGFAGLVTGTLFFIVWRILVWTMAWIEKRDALYADERKAWQEQLAKINQQLENFTNQNAESHKYQRAEHEKMINNLDEHYKVLLRINGVRNEHK